MLLALVHTQAALVAGAGLQQLPDGAGLAAMASAAPQPLPLPLGAIDAEALLHGALQGAQQLPPAEMQRPGGAFAPGPFPSEAHQLEGADAAPPPQQQQQPSQPLAAQFSFARGAVTIIQAPRAPAAAAAGSGSGASTGPLTGGGGGGSGGAGPSAGPAGAASRLQALSEPDGAGAEGADAPRGGAAAPRLAARKLSGTLRLQGAGPAERPAPRQPARERGDGLEDAMGVDDAMDLEAPEAEALLFDDFDLEPSGPAELAAADDDDNGGGAGGAEAVPPRARLGAPPGAPPVAWLCERVLGDPGAAGRLAAALGLPESCQAEARGAAATLG